MDSGGFHGSTGVASPGVTDAANIEPGAPGVTLLAIESTGEEGVRRRLGIGFWIAIAWLVIIILAAALAPILPLDDPNQRRSGPPRSGISWEHWMGTDNLGRDIFSRTIWGARVSLVVGFVSIAFGMLIGGTLGLIAGFYRGPLERVIMGISDVLLSFPAVVLALLLVTFLGRELQWILLAIGILSIAPLARLSRANTLVFGQREFVLASRALGAKNGRIMRREILPNVVIPMGALALLGVAIAIVAEGSLAFLGLSVVGQISWGSLIVEGSAGARLREAPLMAFGPISVLFFTVLALNLAGDRVRDYFDVKQGSL